MQKNFYNVLLMLLSPAESVLLMVLIDRAGEGDKPLVVSYPVLSTLTNVALTSIGKHIQTLERFGFIKIDIDARTNGNSYIVRWKEIDKAVGTLQTFGDLETRVTECKRMRKIVLSKNK
ncbi:MAG: hypothetical protein PHC95_08990 [Parabacteroides sp.]|nr:hypothetical protein [Parabacteroides sp.]